MISFTVPGRCVPCPRPRVVRGKRAYFPKRYTDWLASAQVEALKACGRVLWQGPVSVTVAFYGARPNADIDNLLKSVLDAIQGVIIVDDRQVEYVEMRKLAETPAMTYVEVRDGR
jgi:Holliday junction resolvase RusA-like endonuclease